MAQKKIRKSQKSVFNELLGTQWLFFHHHLMHWRNEWSTWPVTLSSNSVFFQHLSASCNQEILPTPSTVAWNRNRSLGRFHIFGGKLKIEIQIVSCQLPKSLAWLPSTKRRPKFIFQILEDHKFRYILSSWSMPKRRAVGKEGPIYTSEQTTWQIL